MSFPQPLGLVHRWAYKSRVSEPFPVGIRKKTLSFKTGMNDESEASGTQLATPWCLTVQPTQKQAELNKERELVLIPSFRVLGAAVPEVRQHPAFPFSGSQWGMASCHGQPNKS